MELTPRQFALLELLMRRAGEVLSKREILEHVWDFAFTGDPNIVEVYVRQLRTRIDLPFERRSRCRPSAARGTVSTRTVGERARGAPVGAGTEHRLLAGGGGRPGTGGGSVLLVCHCTRSLSGADDDVARAGPTVLAAERPPAALPREVAGPATTRSPRSSTRTGGCSRVSPTSPAARRQRRRPAGSAPEVRTMRDLPTRRGRTEDYRIWVLAATRLRARTRCVYVGPSLESTQEVVAGWSAACRSGLPLLIALLAAATWLIVGRALRPVEAIRRGWQRSAPLTSTSACRSPTPVTRWPGSPRP